VPPSRKNPLRRLRARKVRRQADKQNRERPPHPEKPERKPPKPSTPRNCAQGSKRVVRFAAGVTIVQVGVVGCIVALVVAILWGITK
jgi:cell division septal protein FtsQ